MGKAAEDWAINGVSERITAQLLLALRAEYRLDWHGLHGFAHWLRVRENGLYLAERNGANPAVVEYFAFLHDNQRFSDGHDDEHGLRASRLIRARYAALLPLTPGEVDLLCEACEGHTAGGTKADLTVQTCWDADRLDLFRAGIMPVPHRLCTPEAKDKRTIAWAVARSLGRGG